MKYFRMSYEEVVFRRSYLNILLLNRSIPSFDWKDKDEEKSAAEGKKTKKTPQKNNKFRNETELFLSMM